MSYSKLNVFHWHVTDSQVLKSTKIASKSLGYGLDQIFRFCQKLFLILIGCFVKSYPLHLPSLPGFSQYGAYGENQVYSQDQVKVKISCDLYVHNMYE